jgi:hypothetical protein
MGGEAVRVVRLDGGEGQLLGRDVDEGHVMVIKRAHDAQVVMHHLHQLHTQEKEHDLRLLRAQRTLLRDTRTHRIHTAAVVGGRVRSEKAHTQRFTLQSAGDAAGGRCIDVVAAQLEGMRVWTRGGGGSGSGGGVARAGVAPRCSMKRVASSSDR